MKRGKPPERHTPLKRTAIKRAAPKAIKRKAVRRVSAKRAAESDARRDVRLAVMARDAGRCRAEKLLPDVTCCGPLDVHEPLTRARGGDHLDPDACILLCRNCHAWTHAHPAEAEALGLLRHSWDGPA